MCIIICTNIYSTVRWPERKAFGLPSENSSVHNIQSPYPAWSEVFPGRSPHYDQPSIWSCKSCFLIPLRAIRVSLAGSLHESHIAMNLEITSTRLGGTSSSMPCMAFDMWCLNILTQIACKMYAYVCTFMEHEFIDHAGSGQMLNMQPHS